MTTAETVAQALVEYGAALRGDWSGFDGRSARAVLDDLAAELRGSREPHTIEFHRRDIGLCPDGNGHWAEYCSWNKCPTYVAEEAS